MSGRNLLLGLVALLAQAQNTLRPEEVAQGWVLLFDGASLNGWASEGGAQWKIQDGVLRAESGTYGWLRHRAPFADFELIAEFRTAAGGNSGIFLRSAPGGSPHITGYELQIFDGHARYPTGSVLAHASAQGHPIRAGEWQRFHVLARGPLIQVTLDSKPTVAFRDGKAPAGHIGLQYNPGKPIEFRNLRVRPLGLMPIFDGSTLRGWTTVEPPPGVAGEARWSVRDGAIHVEKGPGQLETERAWRNFALQAEVRGENAAVLVRGKPGVWESGVSSANSPSEGFLTQTIIANEREIHVWSNGTLVSTITDEQPAGTVSLRGVDADYRNLRVRALP